MIPLDFLSLQHFYILLKANKIILVDTSSIVRILWPLDLFGIRRTYLTDCTPFIFKMNLSRMLRFPSVANVPSDNEIS